MNVQGIRGYVDSALQRASEATGVDLGFLRKTAQRESSFNPAARAKTSSAAGLFQFTEQTWLSSLKQYGAQHGYARAADQISRGSNGRFQIANADSHQSIMDLRLDARASSLMAGEMAADNAAYLKGRTGRDPSYADLYAAHFLGLKGSAALIQAAQSQPNTAAAVLFPDAAKSNPSVFYRDGRPLTVSELYSALGGGIAPAAKPSSEGFIQYVSARSNSVRSEQEALISMLLGGGDSRASSTTATRLGGSMFSTEMLRVMADARASTPARTQAASTST